MAGRAQWSSLVLTESTTVSYGPAWCGGFALQTRGASTPGLVQLLDGSTGTMRVKYKKFISGQQQQGGLKGTVGDSTLIDWDHPVLFSTNLFASLGAGGAGSCTATVFYRSLH